MRVDLNGITNHYLSFGKNIRETSHIGRVPKNLSFTIRATNEVGEAFIKQILTPPPEGYPRNDWDRTRSSLALKAHKHRNKKSLRLERLGIIIKPRRFGLASWQTELRDNLLLKGINVISLLVKIPVINKNNSSNQLKIASLTSEETAVRPQLMFTRPYTSYRPVNILRPTA